VNRFDLHAEPPPLPKRLTDPVPVILVGSAVWAAVAVVLGVLAATGVRPLDVWFAATLVGVGLGVAVAVGAPLACAACSFMDDTKGIRQ